MAPEHDHVSHMLDQWAQERPDLNAAPIAVIARILRASRHLDHELGRVLSVHGISNREFDALSALRRSGPPYRLTPTELSHALLFSSGGLTKLLERMERSGFIVREQDPDDRRVIRVALTDTAMELLDVILPYDLEHEERLLAPLDDEQRATLADLLQQLLVAFERADSRFPLPRRIAPADAAARGAKLAG